MALRTSACRIWTEGMSILRNRPLLTVLVAQISGDSPLHIGRLYSAAAVR